VTRIARNTLLVAITCLLAACQASHPLDLYVSARNAINARDWKRATARTEELLRIDPEPGDHLLLAEIHAGQGQVEPALAALKIAIEGGAADPGAAEWAEMLREDPIWQPVRKDPRFAALVQQAQSMRWKPDALKFDSASVERATQCRFSPTNNLYLTRLRRKYELEKLVSTTKDDLERVKRICHWVFARCEHTGSSRGLPQDPIGLLEAAEQGKRLRSVEMATVTAGCLNAVGIPARAVGGQSRDVETRRQGAGNVFVEAWLADKRTWVFVDAEMDVVGQTADGTPLDAVAFRQALASANPPVDYPPSLAMCMYYFTTSLDQRYPIEDRDTGDLMLAPVGAQAPKFFQREPAVPPEHFTHKPAEFHAEPRMMR
jgi:hypothetical protein